MKCFNMKNQTEKMRQHWANKNGVSLSSEFIEAEKMQQLLERKKEIELREKYEIRLTNKTGYKQQNWIDNFKPLPKIYPKDIQPTPVKFDGVDTVGSVFGKPERIYLVKKNVSS